MITARLQSASLGPYQVPTNGSHELIKGVRRRPKGCQDGSAAFPIRCACVAEFEEAAPQES
jgi:hypothetical protein